MLVQLGAAESFTARLNNLQRGKQVLGQPAKRGKLPVRAAIENVGRGLIKMVEDIGGVATLGGSVVQWALRPPFRLQNIFTQLDFVGVDGHRRASEVAMSVAEAMELPTSAPWALRDEQSARMLDEERPLGAQVRERTRLVLIPKSHLG